MKKLIPVLVAAAFIVGCGKHYKVTEATSGKAYYAHKVHERGGSVEFTDAKSGNKVTLDNAEVAKISKKDFKEATK